MASAAPATKTLQVLIVQGKNLGSSRRIYCNVTCINKDGLPIEGCQSLCTRIVEETNKPVWNTTFAFQVSDNFSGLVLRCYESHQAFADKFLGISRLKFNSDKFGGDGKVEGWFSLFSHQNAEVGQIELKAEFNSGAKASTDITPSQNPLPFTSQSLWDSENEKLKSVIVVGIQDKKGEGASLRATIPEGLRKSLKIPKQNPTGEGNQLSVSSEIKKKSIGDIPTTKEGQIKLITELVTKSKDTSIIIDFSSDSKTSELKFKCKNRKTNECTNVVTLCVPEDIQKGEYVFLPDDGVIELGHTGSILRAMNKIVAIYSQKHGTSPVPVFPEPINPKLRMSSKVQKKEVVEEPKEDYIEEEYDVGEVNMDEEEDPAGEGGEDDIYNLDNYGEDEEAVDYTGADGADVDYEDLGQNDWDGGYEDVEVDTQQNAERSVAKYLEKLTKVHKDVVTGIINDPNGDVILRVGIQPKAFVDQLMSKVWHIKYDLLLVIEFTLIPPSYMENAAPPAEGQFKVFQTTATDLNKRKIIEESFGLQWALQKQLERFLKQNWPPSSTNFLIDLQDNLRDCVNHCAEFCTICNEKLEFPMLKTSTCDKQACLFSLDQYGLGIDPAAEIATSPEVVDMLISFTKAVSVGGDPRRFNPFPRWIEVYVDGQRKTFMKDPNAKSPSAEDVALVSKVVDSIPPISELEKCKTSKQLKEFLDTKDPMAYPLLRWILTSNRTHLAKLKKEEVIEGFGTVHQFLLLSSTPAHEKRFQELKKEKGAFWCFHGSSFRNWFSILRTGLKNMSNTEFMTTGAVYGAGIYLAPDSNISIGYAPAGQSWSSSLHNEGGSNLQCLAICEVINADYKANPYFVVPTEEHVVTRFLLVFNSKNVHHGVSASAIKFPAMEFDKYKKAF